MAAAAPGPGSPSTSSSSAAGACLVSLLSRCTAAAPCAPLRPSSIPWSSSVAPGAASPARTLASCVAASSDGCHLWYAAPKSCASVEHSRIASTPGDACTSTTPSGSSHSLASSGTPALSFIERTSFFSRRISLQLAAASDSFCSTASSRVALGSRRCASARAVCSCSCSALSSASRRAHSPASFRELRVRAISALPLLAARNSAR
mmetsp:Transcript_34169/g.86755  ORF Transcript_34169/g.86755 Transcript_34169/m.86755 type:complete len:206 (-) Transcript_34169:197-814(-)